MITDESVQPNDVSANISSITSDKTIQTPFEKFKSSPTLIVGSLVVFLLLLGAFTVVIIRTKNPKVITPTNTLATTSITPTQVILSPMPTLITDPQTPSKGKNDLIYKNGLIYTTNDSKGDLYYQQDVTAKSIKISSNVGAASLSPDKTLIAFNRTRLEGQLSIDTNIYFYDLTSDKIIQKIDTKITAPRSILWSPDGKNFIATGGVDAYSLVNIFSYPEIKSSGTFKAFEYQWLSPSEVVYTSIHELTDKRALIDSVPKGISKFNTTTNQITMLIKPLNDTDYKLIFSDNDNNTIYGEKLLSTDNFKDTSKLQSSYVKIKSDGSSLMGISSLPISARSLTADFSKTAKGSYIYNILNYGDSKTTFLVTIYTPNSGFAINRYNSLKNTYTPIIPNALLNT